MSGQSPAELISKNSKLVPVPPVVNRLYALLNNLGVATEKDIAHVVSEDAELSNRLLKIINSPLYNFSNRIDTISMSVNLMGARQICELVFAAAIIRQFKQSNIDSRFDLETFWNHSITSAVAARMFSLNLTLQESGQYFLAGLLHDVGKLVMYLLLPNDSEKLNRLLMDNNTNIQNAERQVFGFDHATLGAELLRFWHFPDSLIASVAHHHSLPEDDELLTGAAVVHMANVVANNLAAPISADDDNIADPRAIDTLGLDNAIMEKVYEDTYEVMDDLLQLFYYENAALYQPASA